MPWKGGILLLHLLFLSGERGPLKSIRRGPTQAAAFRVRALLVGSLALVSTEGLARAQTPTPEPPSEQLAPPDPSQGTASVHTHPQYSSPLTPLIGDPSKRKHTHRQGALIAGTAILGGAYIHGLVVLAVDGAKDQRGWLAVPVAGPLLALNGRRNDIAFVGFALTDAAMQLAGAIVLITGLAMPSYYVPRDARVVILPQSFGSSGDGLRAVWSL